MRRDLSLVERLGRDEDLATPKRDARRDRLGPECREQRSKYAPVLQRPEARDVELGSAAREHEDALALAHPQAPESVREASARGQALRGERTTEWHTYRNSIEAWRPPNPKISDDSSSTSTRSARTPSNQSRRGRHAGLPAGPSPNLRAPQPGARLRNPLRASLPPPPGHRQRDRLSTGRRSIRRAREKRARAHDGHRRAHR
jgi:hypothetical protein